MAELVGQVQFYSLWQKITLSITREYEDVYDVTPLKLSQFNKGEVQITMKTLWKEGTAKRRFKKGGGKDSINLKAGKRGKGALSKGGKHRQGKSMKTAQGIQVRVSYLGQLILEEIRVTGQTQGRM